MKLAALGTAAMLLWAAMLHTVSAPAWGWGPVGRLQLRCGCCGESGSMSPRLNLWLMRLPLWRWFARATADRIAEEELAQYRDAKARAEVGVFRASGSQLTDDARREQ